MLNSRVNYGINKYPQIQKSFLAQCDNEIKVKIKHDW